MRSSFTTPEALGGESRAKYIAERAHRTASWEWDRYYRVERNEIRSRLDALYERLDQLLNKKKAAA